ncbi:hypothetical protein M1L58_02465 [Gordonia sp. C13]|nr:hypothetical protein [Gordonia sp. C13]
MDVTLKGKLPYSRAIDHVTPIAAGGLEFDLADCRPAHNVCNTARQDRPISDFATPEQRAAFRELIEGLAQAQIARAKHRELSEATKPSQRKPVQQTRPKTPHIFHGIDITDWTPEQKSKLRPWVPMGWDGNSEWNEDGTKRIGWTPFLPGWDLESVVKLENESETQ